MNSTAYKYMREFSIVVLGAESYDPTIEDSYRHQLQVDGRLLVLEILDTAGTEQFVAMRDLYMKTGQGFLLVFSITSQSSLAELESLRDEIIRIKDDENVPIVIVGNKADLEEQRTVPRTKVFSLSQQWGVPYYESSARTRMHLTRCSANVEEVFIDLCRQLLRRDDAHELLREHQHAHDDQHSGSQPFRRRGRKRRRDGHPRCIIL
ncbi:uncharacterized protein E0L32_005648 [Thyridium curvatum]|uniref:Uncharacterized protein n=1 Tax=Thyridium curvatum TaxID=1093900 RepID=A0A507BAW1_9PEZI|nr:uncharacterized protein E0L32_005648 [Thyridium curvatum]TPX13948.1 hypothetical protein E0L32_005648 [Thyridium curvatum]